MAPTLGSAVEASTVSIDSTASRAAEGWYTTEPTAGSFRSRTRADGTVNFVA